ncbi:MAG: hypothetical protein Q8Q50_03520 [Methylobacter sp.]|nr:hypothetical protein [Methylobacter sp.]
MQVFDKFEKKFLFGLTRIFAMLIILGILIAVGVGGIMFADLSKGIDTKVTAIEVTNAIKPPAVVDMVSIPSTQSPENQNLLPFVKLPFVLQKHFNEPGSVKILKGWLDALPLSAHQNFIDEMAKTVTESDKLKLPYAEAIDKYKQLKFKKLNEEISAKAERRTQQLYFIGAIFGAIALIALFSLILVLLAIERNTRRVEG